MVVSAIARPPPTPPRGRDISSRRTVARRSGARTEVRSGDVPLGSELTGWPIRFSGGTSLHYHRGRSSSTEVHHSPLFPEDSLASPRFTAFLANLTYEMLSLVGLRRVGR